MCVYKWAQFSIAIIGHYLDEINIHRRFKKKPVHRGSVLGRYI